MKKAKILLALMVMFTIAGSILAFKAENFGGSTYYVSTTITSCAIITYSPAIFTAPSTRYLYLYYTRIYCFPATTRAYFITIP
ncbi:hypothetical protein SAMN04488505_104241 [Chitinophaga rupis]|uniref:Uncharacterized protein n=1 Tax=Chitinophaga rupis TaxID=573321 RepID=A0A1H7XZY0_9BACT|nr:hypothetical protein SAMN04488505_104241 [Chitinophaga rupis]